MSKFRKRYLHYFERAWRDSDCFCFAGETLLSWLAALVGVVCWPLLFVLVVILLMPLQAFRIFVRPAWLAVVRRDETDKRISVFEAYAREFDYYDKGEK